MELERAHRLIELAMCGAWLLAYYSRMRTTEVDVAAGNPLGGIRAAVRPLWTIALVLMGLTIPLWLERAWQPLAHAIVVPTLVAGGIAGVLTSLATRESVRRRAAGQGA